MSDDLRPHNVETQGESETHKQVLVVSMPLFIQKKKNPSSKAMLLKQK